MAKLPNPFAINSSPIPQSPDDTYTPNTQFPDQRNFSDSRAIIDLSPPPLNDTWTYATLNTDPNTELSGFNKAYFINRFNQCANHNQALVLLFDMFNKGTFKSHDTQTIGLITPNLGFRFLHVLSDHMKWYNEAMLAINELKIPIKPCAVSLNQDIRNFTLDQLELIESESNGIYNMRSIYLKNTPILTPIDALAHLKKQKRASNSLAKTNRTSNTIEFKNAYSNWMNVRRTIKLKYQKELNEAQSEWRELYLQRIQLVSEIDNKIGEVNRKLSHIKIQLNAELAANPAPKRTDYQE